MEKKIIYVEKGSLADKCGIKAGDVAVALNGKTDFDIIDYYYASADSSLNMIIERNGEQTELDMKNPGLIPLGLSFENLTIDKPRFCKNKCIFCFMDQMPKGLRKSLYFKDDDYRLSFLYGNYITLTNVSDEELERIIEKKLTPLYVSVHVSDPQKRKEMMNNDDAPKIMQQLQKLKEGGIDFNIQLVLCPGINDGDYLRRSLDDMITLLPNIISLSCVPVGLTKFRDSLYPLSSFTKEQAEDVIKIIDEYRLKAGEIDEFVTFCASDEFFVLAGKDFPSSDYYGDYVQFENGVGMSRSFIDDVDEFIEDNAGSTIPCNAYLVTGTLGKKVLQPVIEKLNGALGLSLELLEVQNKFFGESVTASGLVCGCDIIKELDGKDKSRPVFIPQNMLMDEEPLFLDNMSFDSVAEQTGMQVYAVPAGGYDFCCMLKEKYSDE